MTCGVENKCEESSTALLSGGCTVGQMLLCWDACRHATAAPGRAPSARPGALGVLGTLGSTLGSTLGLPIGNWADAGRAGHAGHPVALRRHRVVSTPTWGLPPTGQCTRAVRLATLRWWELHASAARSW